MKRKALIVTAALAATLSLAGCAATPPAPAPTPTAPTVATTSAQPPSETPSEAAADCLTPFGIANALDLLTSSWDIAVAARGAPDERHRVDQFNDDVKSLYEDVDHDDNCSGEIKVGAAEVQARTAMLVAMAGIGEAEKSHYNDVAAAGNRLLAAAGVTDVEFIKA